MTRLQRDLILAVMFIISVLFHACSDDKNINLAVDMYGAEISDDLMI